VTRLVFVRHGQAQSYVDGVIGGATGCTGLSEHGRRQAEALRDRLDRTDELADATVLYTSTLPRAIETAEIISPAIGGHAVNPTCELCELHVDDRLDGKPFEDFAEWYEWPPTSNPSVGWAAGAEPWAEFLVRVGRELDRIATAHAGETVVIVCHGGVISAAHTTFAELPIRQPFRVHIENASITEWAIWPDAAGTERWTLVRSNDAAHLADVPAPVDAVPADG
jgi:probable phosphoglycerate mutase